MTQPTRRGDLPGFAAAQVEAGRPPALGGASGRLLRLERRRAAHERHPGRPAPSRQLYALTGSFDAPGGNVLFPSRAVRERHRGDELLPAAQRARRSASPHGRSVPSRWEFVTSDELYRAHLGGTALPGARAGRLRRQPAARPRRQPPRSRGAGSARLLRPRRPLHEPDRRAGRHRPAGRQPLRARGAQDRLRGRARRRNRSSSCDGRWSRRAARPASDTRDRLRPGVPPRSRRPTSGTATSMPPTATSLPRPAFRSRPCAHNPAGVRVPLATRYRKFAEEHGRRAHRLRHADAQDRALLRDLAGRTATRRCRTTRSRSSARARGRILPSATR